MNISVDLRFVFSRFNKSFLIVLDVKFINKSEVVFKKNNSLHQTFPLFTEKILKILIG